MDWIALSGALAIVAGCALWVQGRLADAYRRGYREGWELRARGEGNAERRA